jgi:hypothetical protein
MPATDVESSSVVRPPKTKILPIRATEAEHKALFDAAELSGQTFSAWAMRHLRRIASAELRAAGKAVAFEKKR